MVRNIKKLDFTIYIADCSSTTFFLESLCNYKKLAELFINKYPHRIDHLYEKTIKIYKLLKLKVIKNRRQEMLLI